MWVMGPDTRWTCPPWNNTTISSICLPHWLFVALLLVRVSICTDLPFTLGCLQCVWLVQASRMWEPNGMRGQWKAEQKRWRSAQEAANITVFRKWDRKKMENEENWELCRGLTPEPCSVVYLECISWMSVCVWVITTHSLESLWGNSKLCFKRISHDGDKNGTTGVTQPRICDARPHTHAVIHFISTSHEDSCMRNTHYLVVSSRLI